MDVHTLFVISVEFKLECGMEAILYTALWHMFLAPVWTDYLLNEIGKLMWSFLCDLLSYY